MGLDKAGKDLTVDSFINGMERIHDYKDIFGAELSFGPEQHHGSTRSFLTVVKDGRWVPVEDSPRWDTERHARQGRRVPIAIRIMLGRSNGFCLTVMAGQVPAIRLQRRCEDGRDTPHSYQDKGRQEQRLLPHRHGRACPGHPRFNGGAKMAGTRPAMTVRAGRSGEILLRASPYPDSMGHARLWR